MGRKVLVDLMHMYKAETGVRKFTEEFIELAKEEKGDYSYVFKPSIRKVQDLNNFRKSKNGIIRIYCQLELILWRQLVIPLLSFLIKADIVFFPDYSGSIFPTKAKKVVVFHDTFFWDTPEHYGKIWGAVYRRLSIWSVKFNGAVFTISEVAKERIKSRLNIKAPIEAIPHAARKPQKKARASGSQLMEQLGLNSNEYFLHVGVFEKRKSLGTFIKAYHLLLSRNEAHANLKVLLVGKRPANSRFDDYDAVINLIKELGLEERVILPGYLTDAEIAELYEHALAYVFPSTNEGFGIPILEAFAANCPVIISNQKALTEIAGKACLRFPMKGVEALSDQMEKLAFSGQLREKLVLEGRNRLKMYDRHTYMKKVETYFDELLNQAM